MNTVIDEIRIDEAAQDLDSALCKMFCGMAELLKDKYQITGEQATLAIIKALTSTTSKACTAFINATPTDGLELRQSLREMAQDWALRRSEKPDV
jgi:hypothetical protein